MRVFYVVPVRAVVADEEQTALPWPLAELDASARADVPSTGGFGERARPADCLPFRPLPVKAIAGQ